MTTAFPPPATSPRPRMDPTFSADPPDAAAPGTPGSANGAANAGATGPAPARPRPAAEQPRTLGDILRDTRGLTTEQVHQVLEHQRTHGVRFGEAAIALGLASHEDVLHALSSQFNYAYATPGQQKTNPELIALNQPFSSQAEAIRAIRAQILMRTQPPASEGAPIVRRAIAVVSPDGGDGKTFFCANLGVALAQLGGRTLVVDADLRGPRLHEVFGIEPGAGLSGLLSGRRGEGVIRPVPGVPHLFTLPGGVSPPNPLELVEGPSFGMLLHEVLHKFDHVLVDTPAATFGADNAVIASRCGMALVVARQGRARVAHLQDLVAQMQAANAQLAGVVLNEF